MRWPPQSARTQGLVFGLGVGVSITMMFGVLGEFGWMPGLLTGVCVGFVGAVYFTRAMRGPDEEQDGDEEQHMDRLMPPADEASALDTRRWEFYALTAVPLLTVPVLFAVQNTLLTISVLLLLALSSGVLLRRLRSKQPPEQ